VHSGLSHGLLSVFSPSHKYFFKENAETLSQTTPNYWYSFRYGDTSALGWTSLVRSNDPLLIGPQSQDPQNRKGTPRVGRWDLHRWISELENLKEQVNAKLLGIPAFNLIYSYTLLHPCCEDMLKSLY
jgi:hypothetical protein